MGAGDIYDLSKKLAPKNNGKLVLGVFQPRNRV
jgi:hypothetical protein